jgi:hypothetical protein
VADLVRAGEAARQDQLRARHRLKRFLLRHGGRPPEGWKAASRRGTDHGTGLRAGDRISRSLRLRQADREYLGLIPCEDFSADRQRLGHITKQGSSLVRYLLAEAAQAAVRRDPGWRRRFVHLAMRRDRRIAKVAMARRLAVSLYWMWCKECDYQQTLQFGSHAGEPGFVHGVT